MWEFHKALDMCIERFKKYSFGHMVVCRRTTYHGTESEKHMSIAQGGNFRNEERKDGVK